MSRAAAGFTLIELLVALALMGLTAALLVAGLGTGRTVWATAEARTVAGESVVAAHNLLRDRIEHVFAETRYDARAPYVDVLGDRDALSFYAPAAAARRPAGLLRYRIQLTPGGVLMLYSTPAQGSRIDPRDDRIAGWTAAPLLDGVRTMELAYYGVAPPDRQRRWRDEWQDRPSAPELVRVRLTFAPGDPRRWPELIVRPAATMGTACQLDPLTGQCRGQA